MFNIPRTCSFHYLNLNMAPVNMSNKHHFKNLNPFLWMSYNRDHTSIQIEWTRYCVIEFCWCILIVSLKVGIYTYFPNSFLRFCLHIIWHISLHLTKIWILWTFSFPFNLVFPSTFDYKNSDQLVRRVSTNHIFYFTATYIVILSNMKFFIILFINFCYCRERFKNEVHIIIRCSYIYVVCNCLYNEYFFRKLIKSCLSFM
jgi:hypothetical protein